MREFIDAQLQAGGYSTAREYVRELVRTDQIKKSESQLRDLILTGMTSGASSPADCDFFDGLEAKVKARRVSA